MKWYVEFKQYGKLKAVEDIEAADGKEAINIIKNEYIGATNFHVYKMDEVN